MGAACKGSPTAGCVFDGVVPEGALLFSGTTDVRQQFGARNRRSIKRMGTGEMIGVS